MRRSPARLTSVGGSLTEPSVFGRVPAPGRHPGGRPRRPVDLTEIRTLLAEGLSLRQTARRMGLGYGTLYRAAQAAERGPTLIQDSRKGIL